MDLDKEYYENVNTPPKRDWQKSKITPIASQYNSCYNPIHGNNADLGERYMDNNSYLQSRCIDCIAEDNPELLSALALVDDYARDLAIECNTDIAVTLVALMQAYWLGNLHKAECMAEEYGEVSNG